MTKLNLTPKKRYEEFTFRAYPSDIHQLKEFIDELNADLGIDEGIYTEEDVFSHMVQTLIEQHRRTGSKGKRKPRGKSRDASASTRNEAQSEVRTPAPPVPPQSAGHVASFKSALDVNRSSSFEAASNQDNRAHRSAQNTSRPRPFFMGKDD